jgi:hypothetical protein
MTVAVAWVRQLPDCQELVFVTDSRYSGDGRNFDACPKIMTLPRTDCAIAFAGYTGHALPMMLQLVQAIDSYAPARRRSQDISTLKSHALKVFDGMSKQLLSSPNVSKPEDDTPDATFLFGGYSWIKKGFELWKISYSKPLKRFKADSALWIHYLVSQKKMLFFRGQSKVPDLLPLGRIVFAGDQGDLAKATLQEKLRQSENTPSGKRLDWEPFEVIRDMLRDRRHSETIGGGPQIVKVYQYMQSAPVGVYWPNKNSGKVIFGGRRCLEYENLERPVLDPDTLQSERLIISSDRLAKAGMPDHESA